MTNSYNTQESKRVPVVLNWLGQEELVQTVNDENQEKWRRSIALFEMLIEKFKSHVMKQFCLHNIVN